MNKPKRATPGKRGTLKTVPLRTKLTAEGKQGLQDIAQAMGTSVTEVLEIIARKHGDFSLLGEL